MLVNGAHEKMGTGPFRKLMWSVLSRTYGVSAGVQTKEPARAGGIGGLGTVRGLPCRTAKHHLSSIDALPKRLWTSPIIFRPASIGTPCSRWHKSGSDWPTNTKTLLRASLQRARRRTSPPCSSNSKFSPTTIRRSSPPQLATFLVGPPKPGTGPFPSRVASLEFASVSFLTLELAPPLLRSPTSPTAALRQASVAERPVCAPACLGSEHAFVRPTRTAQAVLSRPAEWQGLVLGTRRLRERNRRARRFR